VLVLEQQAGLLERAFLAGGVDVDQDVDDGQDGGETIHDGRAGGGWRSAPAGGDKRMKRIMESPRRHGRARVMDGATMVRDGNTAPRPVS